MSQSALKTVVSYIDNQDKHHRFCSFDEEFQEFLVKHGLDAEVQGSAKRILPSLTGLGVMLVAFVPVASATG